VVLCGAYQFKFVAESKSQLKACLDDRVIVDHTYWRFDTNPPTALFDGTLGSFSGLVQAIIYQFSKCDSCLAYGVILLRVLNR